jgi:hypothetical protein
MFIRLGQLENDIWEQIQKRSPRQAQAIRYLMENESAEKKTLESIIPAAVLSAA